MFICPFSKKNFSEQTVCDPLLIGAMKDITVTEYSHVLSFIREALEKSTLEKHILVHLSRVLLEVAPEGNWIYFRVS